MGAFGVFLFSDASSECAKAVVHSLNPRAIREVPGFYQMYNASIAEPILGSACDNW